MKIGQIGAPRNAGDVGVGPIPELGSVKVVILNGSRQIDQVVPGVGENGTPGWQTQKVLGENGLPKGIYQLNNATDASKKVHPQKFGGQLVHVDEKNVYQFGPDDGKGKSTIVKHDRKIFDQALNGKEPTVGQRYEVSYSRGVGQVKGELSQEEGAKLQNRKANKI
ncbi:KfrB domain-containing protein (plasmid) [Pseudomonas sp. WOUb67]|uniref:KfrB domain-containing protein n=1 Tax=Pseudomonas sp. WOUb67 TaxID=3161136 RepID=UPI003CF8D5E7